MGLRRGDIVVAALKGAYGGKPRPAVVVQTDILNPTHPSVILAPLSTEIRNASVFRLVLSPDRANGLTAVSEVMVDKLAAAPREKIGKEIGHLDDASMKRLDSVLLVVLGLA